MSRGFTNGEKKEIREKLIEALESELKYQKINKISIDELVSKVGIAKGSFYLFFKSKEFLFMELINKIQGDIVDSFKHIAKEENISEKEKLKKFFFLLIQELQQNPWLYQLSTVDFDKTIRRLPEDMKETLRKNDIADIQKILGDLDLAPTASLEEITVILQIILASIVRKEEFGNNYNTSVNLMVNILVDNLFENEGGDN